MPDRLCWLAPLVVAVQDMCKRAVEVGVLFVKNQWFKFHNAHPPVQPRKDARDTDYDLHVNVIGAPYNPAVSAGVTMSST